MDERQQGMWDKLCRLDGETVARLLTDYHGTQLLSDGFREFLQNEGYLEESPEEEGCHAAASIIEVLQGTVSREAELEYLKEFVRQSCFDGELSRDHLRCLWTAYCFHHNLDVDTARYDNELLGGWNVMLEEEPETADWSSHDEFDSFMCRYLV